ncbi:MAG: LptF/LptG family permease [Flavobacteriales bacterium]|nr:LptF/LptG family permease [Flavobacteriales bacterium]
MKIIDRYIIGKFLGTFIFSITLIILIAVVFDITEKVDDFIEKQAPIDEIILDYYLNFIPYFANLFSPLFTFIAVIYFTSRMASNTEIVAILSSGVGFGRLLYPYMLASLVIASTSFVLNNWVIPPSNAKRLAFEDRYILNPYRFNYRNIHRQIEPGHFVFFESYNNQVDVGYKFSLEVIEDGRLEYKLLADFARWDSIGKFWSLENYRLRQFTENGEVLSRGHKMDTVLNLYPVDFKRRENNVETMDYEALDLYIKEEKMRGSTLIEYSLVEKYKREVFPFATFILTVIAVAIASRKTRGGLGLHILLGLVISFAYILFMQVFTTFAIQGGMPPFIAVWIPNLLFGIFAMFLLRIAPK